MGAIYRFLLRMWTEFKQLNLLSGEQPIPLAFVNGWRSFPRFVTIKDIEILKLWHSHPRFLLCKQKRRMLQGSGCVLDFFPFNKKHSAQRHVSVWNRQQTSALLCWGSNAPPEESLQQCHLLSLTATDGVSFSITITRPMASDKILKPEILQ